MITCCNLISGCIATYFAFRGVLNVALGFIVLGAVFDFFDGFSARLLHVSSPIGKELDSLADVITFGFAPSAMLFTTLWMFGFGGNVWQQVSFAAFLMAAFSALRLAKFNLDERQTMGFIGMPTPANALFWGGLLVGLSDIFPKDPPHYVYYLLLAGMLIACYLLVCEIPMFALKFKHYGWAGNEIRYVFLLAAVVLIAFFQVLGLSASILLYIVLSVGTNLVKK